MTLPNLDTFDAGAFERGTAPLLNLISADQARQFLHFQGDETVRDRIDELAAKHNEGELTADELAEYEGYVRANKFVAILQAQARRVLAAKST